MPDITHATIRMYKMGTGDCFTIKFYTGATVSFKMMIDCGTWSGTKDYLTQFIKVLKEDMQDHINLLVVTHEHKDHVAVFKTCEDLLTSNFTVDKVWMSWTENDKDKKVKQWQKDFGQKRKALAMAADKLQLALKDPVFQQQMNMEYRGKDMLEARQSFADAISNFNTLHNEDVAGTYVGGLPGMNVVKKTIGKDNIDYYSPGDIITNLPGLEGITLYVLGPPLTAEEVKKETGGKGESYDHNKELAESDAFATAVLATEGTTGLSLLPFEDIYTTTDPNASSTLAYMEPNESWRKIDNEWLFSAGSLALRMNSITNNLSLALAIEFNASGRVMLFPGDAEYGSWLSWHSIPWTVPCRNGKAHFTEDLLSRTVFYKVAHHLSHHGTAERLGMEMMTHPDLAAMATLDYDVISSGWKNTMPNRALLKALVAQTKGRLMVMNPKDLFYDTGNTTLLSDRIQQERKKMTATDAKDFANAYKDEPLFHEYTVKG